ncbi:MAG: hypothetical protein AAF739_09360 [Pseudomonadota bacterium]
MSVRRPRPTDLATFRDALSDGWSINTSSRWSADNPALGQCGVTALVANDHFGGTILKTRIPDGWHFYNRIDGERYDFTESQFPAAIHYDDELSNRDEAFADTNASQYSVLSEAVRRYIRS